MNRNVLIPVWAVLGVMVPEAVEKLMGDVSTILPVAGLQKSPSDQSDPVRRKEHLKESDSLQTHLPRDIPRTEST